MVRSRAPTVAMETPRLDSFYLARIISSSTVFSLGLTRSCDAERMAAFIALAKDEAVFGPASEWSELEVETLGNMIG